MQRPGRPVGGVHPNSMQQKGLGIVRGGAMRDKKGWIHTCNLISLIQSGKCPETEVVDQRTSVGPLVTFRVELKTF